MPPDSQEKMKMRSRDCTEHRHTKIIHFSPWCEVSIVPPPPPPQTHLPPFPFVRGEQLNLQENVWCCRRTGGLV